MHEDSLAHKIQGDTLKNASIQWKGLLKKNIHLFKILCILSYTPREATKIMFIVNSNKAMCF